MSTPRTGDDRGIHPKGLGYDRQKAKSTDGGVYNSIKESRWKKTSRCVKLVLMKDAAKLAGQNTRHRKFGLAISRDRDRDPGHPHHVADKEKNEEDQGDSVTSFSKVWTYCTTSRDNPMPDVGECGGQCN